MKINKICFIVLVTVLFHIETRAASVDTINIYSSAMHKNSKCVVILPDSYQNHISRFPVVYLLHGYSGNYADWIKKVPEVKTDADEYQLIIVCPDGNYSSWYFDSPVDTASKYETYISGEVPHYVDSAYRTIAARSARGIAGLSMGGQGALSLAWKHTDLYGAAGSMSGVQDLWPWKNSYRLTEVLGDTLNKENFYKNSVVNIVKKIPSQIPAIIFDCGTSDPFIKTNRQLHQELLKLKIPHNYIERSGTHNWEYWSNAIGYQLLFFHKYFSRLK